MRTPRLSKLFAAALAAPATASAQSNNPFPERIPVGDLAVPITEYARVAPGARLNLLAPDPTGRLFANAQQGQLYRVTPGAGSSPVYFDLSAQAEVRLPPNPSGEQGFQSFAFHPEFATPGAGGFGRFYTVHSDTDTASPVDFAPPRNNNFVSVLTEWTTPDPLADTFSGTSRKLMRIRQPYSNHNAGQLSFRTGAGPGDADFGNLYLGLGDGGSSGDPQNLAQNLSQIHGSILRIDPLGNNSKNEAYGIPDDNPFVSTEDALGEIWAYGLRNPQRFSFDAPTGNLFIADIGQNNVEEIDLGVAGGNYGWDRREGSFPYNGGSDSPAFLGPIAEYDHNDAFELAASNPNGEAITVGTVVRDPLLPDLAGRLLLGDFPTGSVFTLDASGKLPTGGQDPLTELLFLDDAGETVRLLDLINAELLASGRDPTTRADLRFGYGPGDEVFVLNKRDGVIRRLVPEPSTAAMALAAVGLAGLRRRPASRS